MGDYLIGKCYHIRNENTLLYVAGPFNYVLYHVCKKLIKLTKGIGYVSNTDILYLSPNDLIEVDPIIWSKIYKILKMNTIACNTIIQSCEKYESSTGYYVSMLPNKRYKLFEVLKDSQILTRFGNDKAWLEEIENNAVNIELMFSTDIKWISPETYHKVKDNVTNTIEQIDDIWINM